MFKPVYKKLIKRNSCKIIIFFISLIIVEGGGATGTILPSVESAAKDNLVSSHIIDSHEPGACGLCHQLQYGQWKESWHAKAAGSGLLGQLPLFEQDTIKDCLSCHSPRNDQQAIYLTDYSKMIQGVDCTSCHIRDDKRFGSRDLEITPHGPVNADPLFLKSKFCAACHQFGDEGILVNGKPLENTLEEWKASRFPDEGKTCQSCHMPEKSHSFKGVHDRDMVRSGLIVKGNKTNSDLTISLNNVGAGHALPTYITPRIRLLWKGDDESRLLLTVIQRKMDWNPETGWSEIFDTRLMPDEKRVLLKKLPTNIPGYIEVWVDPDADYYDRVYPAILEAMKETSVPELAVSQINQALNYAAQSSYLLYKLRCEAGVDHECR